MELSPSLPVMRQGPDRAVLGITTYADLASVLFHGKMGSNMLTCSCKTVAAVKVKFASPTAPVVEKAR